MVIGMILAAGASTRMGRPKALLPIGADTFVVRLARSFVAAGVDDLVVVTGPERDAIDSTLADAGIPVRLERDALQTELTFGRHRLYRGERVRAITVIAGHDQIATSRSVSSSAASAVASSTRRDSSLASAHGFPR